MAKKPTLPTLSHSAAEDLKRRIAVDEQFKRDAQGTPAGDPGVHLPASEVVEVDIAAIDRRIQRSKRALDTLGGNGKDLTGAQRQTLEKEYNQLRDWLSERMLTIAEMNAFPSKGSEADADLKQAVYEKAVEKAMAKEGEHSPTFIQKAERWKGIGRLLWPDEPERSNMNTIRPEGARSGRRIG